MIIPELPACAAIRHELLIVADHRHHDCLRQLHILFPARNRANDEQGFMTTRGLFIRRRTAMLLMRSAGIPSADPGGYRGDELYSEDLY